MRKKFLIFVVSLLSFGFLFLLSRTTLAAPLNANDINQKTWINTSLIENINGTVCVILDYDVTKSDGSGCVNYGEDGRLQKSDQPGGGALRKVSDLVVYLYANPPASGIQYFADLGKELGITHPVYAQGGIGFTALGPLLKFWKASRNLAYVFFIIAFIVAGLAIMFRMKIDPRTAVTIESALPKIVITLILVTFSYAIAGLLIDLIYVVIGLGTMVIAGAGGMNVPEQQSRYMELNVGDAVGILLGSSVASLTTVITTILGTALGGVIGFLATGPAGFIAAGLPLLIIGVMILVAIFKLFFALLKSYITIILYVIFAPLIIMVGALPGVETGFRYWFMNLLANILVFPAVALFVLLSWVITRSGVPNWSPPALGTFDPAIIGTLIGFGMLLMAPKVPEMVIEAFGFKPSRYGSAIGESLRTPGRMVSGGISSGAQAGATKLAAIGTPWAKAGSTILGALSKW